MSERIPIPPMRLELSVPGTDFSVALETDGGGRWRQVDDEYGWSTDEGLSGLAALLPDIGMSLYHQALSFAAKEARR